MSTRARIDSLFEAAEFPFTIDLRQIGHAGELDIVFRSAKASGLPGFYGSYTGIVNGNEVSGPVSYAKGYFTMEPVKGLSKEDNEKLYMLIDDHPMLNRVTAAYYREFVDDLNPTPEEQQLP